MEAMLYNGFKNVNFKNTLGETALQFLISQKNNLKIISKLLENGADPNILDNDGYSTLIFCANDEPQNYHKFELLLKYGADPYYIDPYGNDFYDILDSTNQEMFMLMMEKFLPPNYLKTREFIKTSNKFGL